MQEESIEKVECHTFWTNIGSSSSSLFSQSSSYLHLFLPVPFPITALLVESILPPLPPMTLPGLITPSESSSTLARAPLSPCVLSPALPIPLLSHSSLMLASKKPLHCVSI